MDTPSSFQTDALIAEDIDAYLAAHQNKSPIDHRLSSAQPDNSDPRRLCPAAADPNGHHHPERQIMMVRVIWIAALAGIGAVTAGLQIDLKSKSASQFAAVVPEPLRNFAQLRIAQQAVLGDDPAVALAETRKLVARRPLPSEHLTLLAAGQAKAGKDDAATTIQIAGRRGWRDPVAQLAVLRLALAAGDRREAARRYAALFLRRDTPDALLRELSPQVFGGTDTTARDAMIQIVVGGERWHAQFLARGRRVIPAYAFASIAAGSMAKGAAFDCRQIKQIVTYLNRDDASAAALLEDAASNRCSKAFG